MRRHVLLPCLLVSALVLAACSGDDADTTGGDTEAPSPSEAMATTPSGAEATAGGLLTGIDVCAHDGEAAPCVDDAGVPALRCTVDVDPAVLEQSDPSEVEVDWALTYRDEPVVEDTTSLGDLVGGGAAPDDPITLDFTMGGLPLPAGDYGCEVSDGEQDLDATATVTGGPDTRAWGVAACAREDAVEVGSGLVCQEHRASFDAVTHLVCSAGVALQGEGVRMEAVWIPPADSQPFNEQQQFLDVDPTGMPVHTLNVTLDARAFGPPGQGQEGDPLPAGEYTCSFREAGSDEGEVFASTTFEVTGG